jgi:hypothetical protein
MLDQHCSGAMQDKNALLVDSLYISEPHVRPCNCLADRFCIRLIILLCFHVRLHVRGWHEPNCVPHRSECPGPMMGRCTSFDANQGRLQLGKERLDLTSAKLAAENPLAFSANSIGMKDVLRDIKTYCDCQYHWTLLHRFSETISVSG